MFASGIAMVIVGCVLLLGIILYQLYALTVQQDWLIEQYEALLNGGVDDE